MIQIAQIGCGYWGPNLVRAFSSLSKAKLTKLVELALDRHTFIKMNFPQVEVITDWKRLLEDSEVDAVILATPAETHYSLAKEFLLAGKHVFVEKPLATQSAEAEELAQIAEKQKLILMVGHTFLYHPAVRYIKEKMMTEIGQPYYFCLQRLNLGRVRSDVNAWWNLAPHDISILLYLMNNEMPETISVSGTSFLQPDIEDVVFAVLNWKNKVTAMIQVSWLDPCKVRRMTVVGSKKMVVYDDVQEDKVTIYDKGIDVIRETPMHYDQVPSLSFSHRSGDIYLPKISSKEPLKEEAEHFVECILGVKSCLTGASHGLDVVRILEAGQKSLKDKGSLQQICMAEVGV